MADLRVDGAAMEAIAGGLDGAVAAFDADLTRRSDAFGAEQVEDAFTRAADTHIEMLEWLVRSTTALVRVVQATLRSIDAADAHLAAQAS